MVEVNNLKKENIQKDGSQIPKFLLYSASLTTSDTQ